MSPACIGFPPFAARNASARRVVPTPITTRPAARTTTSAR